MKEVLEVKLKKLVPEAVVPKYAKLGDAGMDLVATSCSKDVHDNWVYGTGIAVEIPKGYVGLVFPRSSNRKTNVYLTNSVGVIDSGYRGEIMLCFKQRDFSSAANRPYDIGDRIGQIIIMPYPAIEFIESEELEDSDRGEGGFGSTGK